MLNIFNAVIYMSLLSSCVAVIIIGVRYILKKVCPAVFSYALWSILFIRLMMPVSLTSSWSIFNWYEMDPTMNTGINSTAVPQQAEHVAKPVEGLGEWVVQTIASTGGAETYTRLASIWGIATIGLFSIGMIFYGVTMWRLRESVRVHEEALGQEVISVLGKHRRRVYTIDRLSTPIICGFFSPKIIIPEALLSVSDKSVLKNVLQHEMVHMRRKDHMIKMVVLAIACIHWFNPLVWIGVKLTFKDMEQSCDEEVIKNASGQVRKEYAESLLNFAVAQRQTQPLIGVAFGESNVKSRIKGILGYKKPSVWITVLGISIVAVVATMTITDSQYPIDDMRLEEIEATRGADWVGIEDISEYVIQAVVADQDPNFYKHNGMDIGALARAVVTNLKDGGLTDGGTTITEQVLRQAYMPMEGTMIERKQRQLSAAVQIDKKYGKDQVLEVYLNNLYLGNGVIGIKAGAEYYFDKSAEDLTQKEAAQLIAIIDYPTRYDLISNTDNNEVRAQEIMMKMNDIVIEN